jgi:hypothetical protein
MARSYTRQDWTKIAHRMGAVPLPTRPIMTAKMDPVA